MDHLGTRQSEREQQILVERCERSIRRANSKHATDAALLQDRDEDARPDGDRPDAIRRSVSPRTQGLGLLRRQRGVAPRAAIADERNPFELDPDGRYEYL